MSAPRRIAVLTTGRQDWGILRSTCSVLRNDPAFAALLFAGGMHWSKRFGETGRLLEEDGFLPAERLRWISDAGDEPAGAQAATALRLVNDALERHRPDALLLVGDRFETAAAAVAATIARVPLVHLHGGEESLGAFDDAFRHAITKLAHLHLVSHPDHARRVVAMGEDPAAVHIVGAPGLDNARRTDLPDRAQVAAHLGLALDPPVIVVTLHPATLGGDPAAEAEAVAAAMDAVAATYVITMPNTDPGHEAVRARLARAARATRRVAVDALGDRFYWGLLNAADALVGNSSSALIEAPVLGLPAVNVGDRQRGRLRGENVVDAPANASAIAAALRAVLAPGFRARLAGRDGPYGDGRSAERILDVLRGWAPPVPPAKPPVRLREGTA